MSNHYHLFIETPEANLKWTPALTRGLMRLAIVRQGITGDHDRASA